MPTGIYERKIKVRWREYKCECHECEAHRAAARRHYAKYRDKLIEKSRQARAAKMLRLTV